MLSMWVFGREGSAGIYICTNDLFELALKEHNSHKRIVGIALLAA
jgi:hypothetical protein